MVSASAVAQRQVFSYTSTIELAERLPDRLDMLAGKIESTVVPNLDRLRKHIHPLGYLTVDLDDVPDDLVSELYESGDEELGRKRAHFWIPGFRPRPPEREVELFKIQRPGYPTYVIYDGQRHTHERFAVGRALELGFPEETYRDILFREGESSAMRDARKVAMDGLAHVFEVDYSNATAQRLVYTGRASRLEPDAVRVSLPGKSHQLNASMVHQSVVPDSQGAGTVVFNAHRKTRSGPYAYFNDAISPKLDARRDLTPDEEERVEAYLRWAFAQWHKSQEGIEVDHLKAFTEKRPGLKEEIDLAIQASRRVFPDNDATQVGSVVVCEDRRFVGANVRRSSYSDTSCAVRVALDQALGTSPEQIDRVIIYDDSDRPIMEPCDHCKRLIKDGLHHLPRKQTDVNIIMVSADRNMVASAYLSQLLPHIRLW